MRFKGTNVIMVNLDDFVLWKICPLLTISFVPFEERGFEERRC